MDDQELLLESCRVVEDEQHAHRDLSNISALNQKSRMATSIPSRGGVMSAEHSNNLMALNFVNS